MPKGKAKPYAAGDRPFTPKEVRELLDLLFSGRYTMYRAAAWLGRSVDSIETKLWKVLHNYKNEGYPMGWQTEAWGNSGKRWTPFERECAHKAVKRLGKGPEAIQYLCRVFGRRWSEIEDVTAETSPLPKGKTLFDI